MNVCAVNCNSLVNKLVHVYDLICRENISVLGISETWLVDGVSSSYVQLPGFNFYRGDALGSVRKHGSGLYVAESINSIQLDVELPNVTVVKLVNLNIFVIAVYRPPSYSQEENSSLREFLLEICVGID